MHNSGSKYAAPFAAWEMRLYLDTHPDDTRALSVYRQLCERCAEGSYACVPDCMIGTDRWRWIDNPWPWDYEANRSVGGRRNG